MHSFKGQRRNTPYATLDRSRIFKAHIVSQAFMVICETVPDILLYPYNRQTISLYAINDGLACFKSLSDCRSEGFPENNFLHCSQAWHMLNG
jgi:hypothetical protein